MVNNFCISRANESGNIIIFVNSAGAYFNFKDKERYKPIGISQVVFPGLGKVASAPRNIECLLIVDLPEYADILKDFKKMYGS